MADMVKSTDTINKEDKCVTPDRPTRSVPPNAPPRPRNTRGWGGKEGMCEVCGLRRATENLMLEYGSHRECYFCWND